MRAPRDRRTTDQRLAAVERKLLFALRAIVVAGLLWVASTALGFWQIENQRAAGRATSAQIIGLGCSTDNAQDRLLAHLVAASIAQSGDSFGAGIDPSTLTPFDRLVLATIAKVSAAQPTDLTDRFQRALSQLRDFTDCQALVQSYLAGDANAIPGANQEGGP